MDRHPQQHMQRFEDVLKHRLWDRTDEREPLEHREAAQQRCAQARTGARALKADPIQCEGGSLRRLFEEGQNLRSRYIARIGARFEIVLSFCVRS